MDEIADFAGIDLALEWGVMQEAHRAEYGESAAGSRFGDFFQLFQMAQLDELGTELGVHVADAKGKEAKVKLLVSRDRNLKLPKCIKPLVAKKPAKRRRR
jgi:hypothetical protein